jgi:hypothetical protein
VDGELLILLSAPFAFRAAFPAAGRGFIFKLLVEGCIPEEKRHAHTFHEPPLFCEHLQLG